MNHKQMFRQGDVLIEKIASVPRGAKRKPLDNGRIILAYGEATGHAHVVQTDAEAVEVFLAELNGETYLSIPQGGQVVHEEHATITLPPGTFKVVRQREYTPTAIVNVSD